MRLETLNKLNKLNIFTSLSLEEVSCIHTFMKQHKFSKGRELFHEGDPGEEMYIVLDGEVAIFIQIGNGEETEVARIKEGSFFGEMSIIEKDVRSATCRTVSACTLLSLNAQGFQKIIRNEPQISIKIMNRMLNTAINRLQNTGAFLSSMIKWGEDARSRAVSDDFTGLYNRRFFDETLKEEISNAVKNKHPFSLVMVDLDHFGTLNREYGENVGDAVILAAVKIFREIFDETDILVRYGGDEFAFMLIGKDGKTALSRCRKLGEVLHKIDLLRGKSGSLKYVSASIGIAVCPEHGTTVHHLLANADKALYASKEAGRDRATLFGESKNLAWKVSIKNTKERNIIIDNIINTLVERNSFLLNGHKNPDEDCIASMAAFALLCCKFSRQVSIVIDSSCREKHAHLLDICRQYPIKIIESPEQLGNNYDTVAVFDTPKLTMLEYKDHIKAIMQKENVKVLEVDHHLEADGTYIGDENYRLVDNVSSSSELVGHIAMKLSKKKHFLEQYGIANIFCQDFLLAVLIGILSDTQHGKFMNTEREKRHLKYFRELFDKSRSSKAIEHTGSRKAAIKAIEYGMAILTEQEEACYHYILQYKKFNSKISWIAMNEQESDSLAEQFGTTIIPDVARYAANILAEESNYVSLIAYYDKKPEGELIQLRMRRSKNYRVLDLRKIIEYFQIKNGGGHEGAIGFRLPSSSLKNFDEFINDIVLYTTKIIEENL
ncbi:MAG: hypothetical protein B0D92_01040 [Spirochaeta sp. LUC14_002_19_P3]|nr:MAG: hypothetical protein B0D92_01040 [Spirochaeta sp. LUC14_002_19_P3]